MYEARNLFPELDRKRTRAEQRAYVMERLVELARDKELFLTDCVNQPGTRQYRLAVRDYVGQCLLGHDHSPNGEPRRGARVPRELSDYKCRIVSINHRKQVDIEHGAGRVEVTYKEGEWPITFCAGKVPIQEHPDKGTAMASGLNAASSETEIFVPDIVETGETDIELNAPEAWACLHDCGEHVARAVSRRAQSTLWKCKEVRPGEDPKAKAPKETRTPRRGRKAASQEQSSATA